MKELSSEEYDELSAGGGPVPVYREVPGDLLTPVSAFLAISARSDRAFLLESVVGGERLARYSFLGRDPVSTLEQRGGAVLEHVGTRARTLTGDLLTLLRSRLGPHAAEVPGLPRFTGGAVGYLTYDAVRLFEAVPDRHGSSAGLLASFSFYRSLVAFDHVRQRIVLIANAAPGERAAFEEARDVLDGLEQDLRDPRRLSDSRLSQGAGASPSVAEGSSREVFGDGQAFKQAVSRIKGHIAAGDVFQVVLSRKQTFDCPVDPITVYRALRMVNPSPYMYFLKDGGVDVVGASPEMLVRVEKTRVQARPIAGTRPRGRTDEEDERLGRELLADEKERAEHVMLVDLGRNDLGRVCRFGTVTVPDFMKLERYSHVTHIVSSVQGELATGKDALEALVAAFPAGTLSGAPKIRAMEIIDELEPCARGLYGGACGYVDLRGNLDFCIAIRTLVLERGPATSPAGAGLGPDSEPEAERKETEAKAAALVEALSLAARL